LQGKILESIGDTHGTCVTITLLDALGGKSMNNLVKEKFFHILEISGASSRSSFISYLESKNPLVVPNSFKHKAKENWQFFIRNKDRTKSS
jgi:hypothetical protein